MSTYQQLVQDAAARIRRPDASELLFSFVGDALKQISENEIGSVPELFAGPVEVTLSANEYKIIGPADLGRPLSIIGEGETAPLSVRHHRVLFEEGWPAAFSAQQPTRVAQMGTSLLLDGKSSTDKKYYLCYQMIPARPTAQTDPVVHESLYEIILAKVLALGLQDQRDYDGSSFWENEYQRRLAAHLDLTHVIQENRESCVSTVVVR